MSFVFLWFLVQANLSAPKLTRPPINVLVVFPDKRIHGVNKVEKDRLAIVSLALQPESAALRFSTDGGLPGLAQQTDNFPTENISLAADPTDSLVSERWIGGWTDEGGRRAYSALAAPLPGWRGEGGGKLGKQVPPPGTTSWGAAGPFHCRAGETIKTKPRLTLN